MYQDRAAPVWAPYTKRFAGGEWRARVFLDMVLCDARALASASGKLSVLDVGCGRGFDNDPRLQKEVAAMADRYIGIEPDGAIELSDLFTTSYRCSLEEAPLDPNSIDLGFAVMVLEHLADPARFWDKIHRTLKKGGVFWGFTVDARHGFVSGSVIAKRLGIKDRYLNWLHGQRGNERYENYDVFYRSNTPDQIQTLTRSFAFSEVLNFRKVGQMDYYLPDRLRWVGRCYDRAAERMDWPGSTLAVRVVK